MELAVSRYYSPNSAFNHTSSPALHVHKNNNIETTLIYRQLGLLKPGWFYKLLARILLGSEIVKSDLGRFLSVALSCHMQQIKRTDCENSLTAYLIS